VATPNRCGVRAAFGWVKSARRLLNCTRHAVMSFHISHVKSHTDCTNYIFNLYSNTIYFIFFHCHYCLFHNASHQFFYWKKLKRHNNYVWKRIINQLLSKRKVVNKKNFLKIENCRIRNKNNLNSELESIQSLFPI